MLAAEVGTAFSFTLVRTSFPAQTAQQNRVSSTGSVVSASRARATALRTWEMI